MNRIVKEHYPVEKLPDDIRSAIGDARSVTLVIEPEATRSEADGDGHQSLLADMATWRLDGGGRDSAERVRALRDEWDD
jgi:hypothetical protein